jgi:Eukaryotic cytochrome b561
VGVALLALYIAQCVLGAFIHFVKIPFGFKRPPQNYGHAILGLTILGLALYQVRLGYKEEWPNTTGRPSLVGSSKFS